MTNRTTTARFFALAFLTAVFYGFIAKYYEEFFLNSDGAYTLMQARELLTLRHGDFLHIGYEYVGVVEPILVALLSFALPLGFAYAVGYAVYWGGFYLLLRHLYSKEIRWLMWGFFLIPFPVAAGQSFGSRNLIRVMAGAAFKM